MPPVEGRHPAQRAGDPCVQLSGFLVRGAVPDMRRGPQKLGRDLCALTYNRPVALCPGREKRAEGIRGRAREKCDAMRRDKIHSHKLLGHITLVKGGIEAGPGYAEVRGEADPHVLSCRPDGPRGLSATENGQLLGHVIVP